MTNLYQEPQWTLAENRVTNRGIISGGMPLFEYQCRSCDHRFELLVREQTVLACPECHGTALDKQLSVFAVGGSGSKSLASAPPGPCGTCGDPRGPGSCSMN